MRAMTRADLSPPFVSAQAFSPPLRPIDIEGNPDKGAHSPLPRGSLELRRGRRGIFRARAAARKPQRTPTPDLNRPGEHVGELPAPAANATTSAPPAAPASPPPPWPDHNDLCLCDGARSRRRAGSAGERCCIRCCCNQKAAAAGDGDPTQHGSENAPAVEVGHGFTLLAFGS